MKFLNQIFVNLLINIVPIELSIESKIILLDLYVFVAVFFLSKNIPPILKKYGFCRKICLCWQKLKNHEMD